MLRLKSYQKKRVDIMARNKFQELLLQNTGSMPRLEELRIVNLLDGCTDTMPLSIWEEFLRSTTFRFYEPTAQTHFSC